MVYNGNFDVTSPISWKQGSAPYANQSFRYCYEGTFGACSCGLHTITNILLKSEYWKVGKLATDAYVLSEDNGIGSSYDGIPSYDWAKLETATDGYLKYEGSYWPKSRDEAKDILKELYNKGQYAAISVTLGGSGHLVALDYVEEDGDVVIIDSGIRAKYLDQMDGGQVWYIQAFSSPINSRDAAHFWEGDRIGHASYTKEMKKLSDEVEKLEEELKKDEVAKDIKGKELLQAKDKINTIIKNKENVDERIKNLLQIVAEIEEDNQE